MYDWHISHILHVLHVLHVLHIYIDNPSQLTFVFAKGFIDSEEDFSSTHSLNPMNYSKSDDRDCPDGYCHTSAPPRQALSIGHWYSMGASCAQLAAQGLRGPASAVLQWHRTPRVLAARRLRVLQHARHIIGTPSEVSHWANERLVKKLRHSNWHFTLDWLSICTLNWQSICVINGTAPTAVITAVANVSSGTYWT